MADNTGDTCCCNGRCRRRQAPMVMRSGLTDTWWVVLRYKALGDGRYEALDKHQLHPESVKILEAVLDERDELRSQLTEADNGR